MIILQSSGPSVESVMAPDVWLMSYEANTSSGPQVLYLPLDRGNRIFVLSETGEEFRERWDWEVKVGIQSSLHVPTRYRLL
jgi:hypothetical protein